MPIGKFQNSFQFYKIMSRLSMDVLSNFEGKNTKPMDKISNSFISKSLSRVSRKIIDSNCGGM